MGQTLPVYVAPDGNDLLVWTLNESSSPFANSGAAGSLDMVPKVAGPTVVAGAYGHGVQFTGVNDQYLTTGAGGTNVGEVARNFTVSGWYFFRAVNPTGGQGNLLVKSYRPDSAGWNYPFVSLVVGLAYTTNRLRMVLNNGGLQIIDINVYVPVWQWVHCGITYDGSSLRTYLDGLLVSTNSISGDIDYGSHGPWTIGGNLNDGVIVNGAIIDDVRLANVVRNDAWFAQFRSVGPFGADDLVGIGGTSAAYRMMGYDATLGRRVFWIAPTIDASGTYYTGPGALSDIQFVNKVS